MAHQFHFWVFIWRNPKHMHPWVHMFIAALLYNSWDVEATYGSINRWTDTEDVVHIFNNILLSHRKNEILSFTTTSMDLEGIMLNAITQRKKIPYDFTYTWHLKNKINGQTKQKQIYRYREQIDCCRMGGGLGEWAKKVKGIKKYKLPVIKIFTGV